ncbi:MAG: glycerol-3-phosphate dehydrogenase, partial [Pseudomonadota bacterium]
VQGRHIVVPKLHNHDRAYIFQNADNRIIFALPYEQDYTLIGTTDKDYEGDPKDVKISPQEVTYLCDAASEYFKEPILADHIVWSYSGVRPLFDDGASAAQEATRDYVLREDGEGDDARVINIFGGKITTYRRLAESMLEKIEAVLGKRKSTWTADSHLTGGDFKVEDFDNLVADVQAKYPFVESALAWRLVRSYGTKVWQLLGDATTKEDMGPQFGGSLTGLEVDYLMQNEWAQTAEDVVWRRSKLGIRLTEDQIAKLDHWMRNSSVERASAAN